MAKQLTLDMEAGQPQPTGPFAQQLLALDPERWGPYGEETLDDPDLQINRVTTTRNLQYELATWCFDSGYLEEQDYQRDLLARIKRTFGNMMRYRVLICMQTRRHDT